MSAKYAAPNRASSSFSFRLVGTVVSSGFQMFPPLICVLIIGFVYPRSGLRMIVARRMKTLMKARKIIVERYSDSFGRVGRLRSGMLSAVRLRMTTNVMTMAEGVMGITWRMTSRRLISASPQKIPMSMLVR